MDEAEKITYCRRCDYKMPIEWACYPVKVEGRKGDAPFCVDCTDTLIESGEYVDSVEGGGAS